MKRRLLTVLIVMLWLVCGFFAEANWVGNFYGEFGSSGIETMRSATDSGLVICFALAPLTAPMYWVFNEYKPRYDWIYYVHHGELPRE